MTQRFGIILLEKNEIIIRIYEADNKEWKLQQYQSIQLKISSDDESTKTTILIESLADFLASEDAGHVNEWKVSARELPYSSTQQASLALGLHIEELSPLREQELLCKGIFTELW